jgi:predicted transcriptional regulator
VDEKVAMLERQKLDMLRQKTEIERKLGELRARMKANAEDAAGEEQARQVANPGKGGGSQ